MEKYRRFSDQGTGIQPFVPMRCTESAVTRFLITPVVLLLRFPLVFVFGVLIAVFGVVLPAAVGALVPSLGQLLRSLLLKPLLRILLLVLGVNFTHRTWPLSVDRPESPYYAGGDIVVTNFCSYVDVLYHALRLAPVFAFAHDDTDGTTRVVTLGLIGAMRYAAASYETQLTAYENSTTVAEASAMAAQRGAPLVLFFEGTPTNGKGVLAAPDRLITGTPQKTTKFHLTALLYHDSSSASVTERPSLTYPSTGGVQAHLWGLLATPLHSVKAVTVSPSRVPQLSAIPDHSLLWKSLIAKLCEASGLKAMQLKRKDKAAFLEHWFSTQGSSYLK